MVLPPPLRKTTAEPLTVLPLPKFAVLTEGLNPILRMPFWPSENSSEL